MSHDGVTRGPGANTGSGLRPEGGGASRVEECFAHCCELPAAEREEFLARACAREPALHVELVSLLAAHDAADELAPVDPGRAAALLAAVETEGGERTVGPYRLLRTLGQGGMGTVFLAERVEGGFEQRVALKLIKRGMDSEAILERFRQERQILARLNHPGIARLLDGGVSENGQPYFAMEHVVGLPIHRYATRERLGLAERLRLFLQVCDAVQEAHRNLVIHRDLKPANILVTDEGRVKLLDFGIAKLLAPDAEPSAPALTQVEARPLTPEYASPEQVLGQPMTTASDVYGLGVVLYELLTGRLPYEAPVESREALARAVSDGEPLPASTAARREAAAGRAAPPARLLQGDLDAILARALAREAERRYPSAEAFAEDLRRHLQGQPVRARPPGLSYRLAKFVRRHRLGVATGGAALCALLAGLVGTAWQARVAAAERDRAASHASRAEAVQEFLTTLLQSVDPYRTGGEIWTAQELLDRGVERIESRRIQDARVEAELLGVLGGVSRSLGQLERAETLWRRSLELRRAQRPRSDAEVAEGLRGLAAVLYDRDEHAGASALLEEALGIERRRWAIGAAPDGRALARTLAHLGRDRHQVGRLEEARELYQEAELLWRTVGEAGHAEAAELLVSQGTLARAQGDLAASERLLREAVEIERETLGERHPGLAVTLGNLAGTLRERGDFARAEPLYREALTITREAFGDEHPEVSTKLNNLAALLRSRGDYEEAAELFAQVLQLDRKLLGERHVYVAYSMDNLATALTELGHLDEALRLFDGAHGILVESRGEASVDAAVNRTGRAVAMRLGGDPRTALLLLREARAALRSTLPSGHPREAGVVAELAATLAELDHLSEAEALFREAVDMRSAAGQAIHPDTVAPLVGLGRVLTRSGRLDEAIRVLEEGARAARSALPSSHWRRDDAELALASGLLAAGERQRAGELARDLEPRVTGRKGPRHERLRRELAALRDAS